MQKRTPFYFTHHRLGVGSIRRRCPPKASYHEERTTASEHIERKMNSRTRIFKINFHETSRYGTSNSLGYNQNQNQTLPENQYPP
jgi:hypothetical protein